MKRYGVLSLLTFLLALALSACEGEATPYLESSPTPSPIATTQTVGSPTPTPEPAPESTPVPTPTPQPTPLPLPTAVPPSPSTPAYIGTPVPPAPQPLQVRNLDRLARVAAWGRGTLRGIAFAPDGASFVVGSAFGIATYDLEDLQAPPRWTPLHPPYPYESLSFSDDGKYLRLQGYREENFQVRRYPGGEAVAELPDVTWPGAASRLAPRDPGLQSPDGALELTSRVEYHPPDRLESIREVWDAETGELLYRLPDDTIILRYEDRHEPEGCDLSSFSLCGHTYEPLASIPYRAGFSPSGDSLAIVYRPPDLGNPERFSTLRVYRAGDGALLHTMGNFQQPVKGFAYAPDGDRLAVGYVDGSVQLWDLRGGAPTFTARHLSAPLVAFAYSADGNYLLLQRPGWVEARRSRDGALRSRYRAAAFAPSPTGNAVALGGEDGTVRVHDLNSGEELMRIEAHDDEVYALAFSPDGKTLTSSGQDCAVRSWDVRTGAFLHDFEESVTIPYDDVNETPSRIFIHHAQYVPGADQLLGYGSWARVVSWDARSGERRYLIEPQPVEYYRGMLTLDPHYPEFFGVDLERGRFYVDSVGYDLETGERLGEYEPPEGLPEGCGSVGPTSRNGELRLTLGHDAREGQLCALDAEDSSLVRAVELFPEGVSPYLEVEWLYLSPDGTQLALTTRRGPLYVYQITPPGRDP